MRCAGIYLQRRVLDQLGGEQGRIGDRHDLVVIAMNNQRRDIDLLVVFGEVGFGELLDTVQLSLIL